MTSEVERWLVGVRCHIQDVGFEDVTSRPLPVMCYLVRNNSRDLIGCWLECFVVVVVAEYRSLKIKINNMF